MIGWISRAYRGGRCLSVLIAAGCLLAPRLLLAHHGDAGRYEDHMTTITGTVVEFNFVNPHSLLVLDVEDENGNVERWQCETGAPNGLRRQNFTPETVKVGDTLTISARRRKNGEPYMSITGGATVFNAEGEEIYHGR
jgi:hypothetical protein